MTKAQTKAPDLQNGEIGGQCALNLWEIRGNVT